MTGSIPEDRTTDGRRCGYTVIDREGIEQPCDRPATGWRWYQDVDHEDTLDVACSLHENEGGRRLAAVERERDELRAEVEHLDESRQRLVERLREVRAEMPGVPLTGLAAAVVALRSQLAEAKSDQARWEGLWKKAANGVLGLQGENEQLRAQLADTQAQLAEVGAAVARYGEALQNMRFSKYRNHDDWAWLNADGIGRRLAALSVAPQPEPEDGCAECTESGTRNCVAGCKPEPPASDEPARCRGIDPAYPGQRCEQARYHEGPCFEGPCPTAQCAYQFTDGTMCRCDLGSGHAGMHHCSVAPQPQPEVACGNCGEPYPGQHIIENEYGNRVVICPRHTAYGTTSVVHDGFIAQCDACAAVSGAVPEETR